MDTAALLRRCTLVRALPVVAGAVLSTIRDGHVNLTYARDGAFFAWFMFMAAAISGRARRAAAADGRGAIIR